MKLMSSRFSLLFPLVLLSALAGCAAAPQASGGPAPANMAEMDTPALCELHKQMMASGKTPVEQQAMMQERMKSMAPDMRQRMMARLAQCR